MTSKPWILVRASLLWYTAAAIAAQSVAPPSYSWWERTISALGAQGYPYGWIMRVGMIGYGLLFATGLVSGFAQRRRPNGPELLLLLHACLMILAGLISTLPLVPGVTYSAAQGLWHWNFAMAAGASFGVSVGWRLLAEADGHARLVHLATAVLLAVFSAGFGLASARTIAVAPGLVQRLLHGVGMVWLLISYGRAEELATGDSSRDQFDNQALWGATAATPRIISQSPARTGSTLPMPQKGGRLADGVRGDHGAGEEINA